MSKHFKSDYDLDRPCILIEDLPSLEEIQVEAKTYDNSMTSIAEGVWMPRGFEAGAKWVCDRLRNTKK